MRLNEFANAEAQLALWKLVSDNVWAAIRRQADEQARHRAAAKRAAAHSPKRTAAKVRIPTPPAPKPLPKPKPLQAAASVPTQQKQPAQSVPAPRYQPQASSASLPALAVNSTVT
jgi:hypothetical protein